MKPLTLATLGLTAGYAVADAGTSATSPAIEGPSATLDQAKCGASGRSRHRVGT